MKNYSLLNENKLIQICSSCKRACCWYGEFMCENSSNAAIELKTVKELRELKAGENEEYWSDDYMSLIYGEGNPFGLEKGKCITENEKSMKGLLHYKVFGLSEKEGGELTYGYIETALKDKYNNPVDISEDIYNEAHEGHRKYIADMLKVDVSEVIPITQKEYLENTDEEDSSEQ